MFGTGCVVYCGVDRWAFSRGEESVLGRENGAICSRAWLARLKASEVVSQQRAEGTSLAFRNAAKHCRTVKRGVIANGNSSLAFEVRRCSGAFHDEAKTPIVNLGSTFRSQD